MSALLNTAITNTYLAQSRIGTGDDQEAGNELAKLMEELDWLPAMFRLIGVVLFVWLIGKWILDLRRGTGAGGGLLRVLGGIFGLVIALYPDFLPMILDGIVIIFRSFANFASGVFDGLD